MWGESGRTAQKVTGRAGSPATLSTRFKTKNLVPVYLCLVWGQEAPASSLLGLGEDEDTQSQCTCSGAVEPFRAPEDTELWSNQLTQRFERRGCGDGQDCSAEGSPETFLRPRRAPQHPNLLFVLQGQIPQQAGKLYSVKYSPRQGTSLLSMMM